MSATKKGKKTRKPLIILTAGGTGGHVYPAEALADELLRRGYRVELITDTAAKTITRAASAKFPIMRFWPALWSANPACSKSKA